MSGVTCPNCEMVLTAAGGVCPHCAELVVGAGQGGQAPGPPSSGRGGITLVPLLKADAVQPKPKELEIDRGSPGSEGGSFFELPEEALQLARARPVRAPVEEAPFDSSPQAAPQRSVAEARVQRRSGPSPLLWVGVVALVVGLAALALRFLS